MKTPFIITFKKKFSSIDKEKIIKLFLINIRGIKYKYVNRSGDNKVITSGIFYFFDRLDRLPWHYWLGIVKKTEFCITNDNTVKYSIDITFRALIFIFTFLLLGLIIRYYPDKGLIFTTSILLLGLFLDDLFTILLHRSVFIKTIRFENQFIGDYNWVEILKSKTDKELRNIIKGNTTLTNEVRKLAKIELEKRRKT